VFGKTKISICTAKKKSPFSRNNILEIFFCKKKRKKKEKMYSSVNCVSFSEKIAIFTIFISKANKLKKKIVFSKIEK
jgi:hypothetical protein